MYLLSITSIVLSIVLWNLAISQNGQLISEIRFTRVANCNKTGLKWYLENITFVSQYPKMLISGVQNVTGEVKKLSRMNMRFERCNDQGFNCEDFQNWNVPNFCPMLNWKDQVWSGFIDAIHPTFKCPIKKMVYEIRNATIDVDAAIKWYPDCVNYRWKVLNEYFDEHNSAVFCAIFEAHIYQYTRRNRNKPH